jgi:hypothetical protein
MTTAARPGRNEPCHCGSGRKYKHCCLDKDEAAARAEHAKAAAEAPDEARAAPSPAPVRAAKHKTEQPWKKAATRSFHRPVRTPRKVGGG